MAQPTPTVSSETLRTLHRIHRQLTDLRARLERGPKRIRAAEAACAQREKEVADIQAEYKKLRVATDEKQLQLKSNEQKLKDLKTKLNTAATNKEYQILNDGIAADRMANDVLSDEILEGFERLDGIQKKIKEAEEVLAAARKRLAEVTAEANAQAPSIQADVARAEAELRQSEAALPPDVAEHYQRVVRQKGEDGLAPIQGETCAGCQQAIPVNLCAQVAMGKPAFCRSCGRLLYIPE